MIAPMAVAAADAEDQAGNELRRWTYVMEVVEPLSIIDLEVTVLSKLLSPQRHDQFLEIMRHNYTRFGTMYRFSGPLSMIVVFTESNIGRALSIPSMLMSLPAFTCSMLMLSSEMVSILTRQYEFWFFTIMNTINWGTLATFYSDVRAFSVLNACFGTQTVIFFDANLRTVVSVTKSSVIATPVLIMVASACFFRLLDTPEDNYRVIPVANIKMPLVDVFVNTAVTLSIFITRKAYNKRKALKSNNGNMRVVRCVVLRSKLRLRPMTDQDGPIRSAQSQATIVRRASQPTVQRTARVEPIAERSLGSFQSGHQQQVTLVSLKFKNVDVRRTVVPRLAPLLAPIARAWTVFLMLNGAAGLFLTTVALSRSTIHLDEGRSEFSTTLQAERIAAILAAVTTSVCSLPFFLCYQRDLLKSLSTNFDFLFSSVQFGLAMIFLADMLRWDHHALGAVSWFLWFHLVLLLDTLMPPVKANLWFKKVYTMPVVLMSLVGVGLIIYSFFFADVDIFEERTLLEFRLNGHDIALRTKSLLLNRLFTVFLWSARLVWEVGWCAEDELIFIRGGLNYYNPMEMFSPVTEIDVVPMSVVSGIKKRSALRRFTTAKPHRVSVQQVE